MDILGIFDKSFKDFKKAIEIAKKLEDYESEFKKDYRKINLSYYEVYRKLLKFQGADLLNQLASLGLFKNILKIKILQLI